MNYNISFYSKYITFTLYYLSHHNSCREKTIACSVSEWKKEEKKRKKRKGRERERERESSNGRNRLRRHSGRGERERMTLFTFLD
jgi:hypothetical protein